jgi:hypothetical protein
MNIKDINFEKIDDTFNQIMDWIDFNRISDMLEVMYNEKLIPPDFYNETEKYSEYELQDFIASPFNIRQHIRAMYKKALYYMRNNLEGVDEFDPVLTEGALVQDMYFRVVVGPTGSVEVLFTPIWDASWA